MSDEREIKSLNYTVKTTPDITEAVDELVKTTGLSNKDLFSAMVTAFKTNLMAGSETEQTEDMQQLKYHLTHAESIFMAMVQKVHDLKQNFSERIDQEARLHQSVVDQVERGRQQAEVDRDKARLDLSTIKEQLKEIGERNSELESGHKSSRITIELLTTQKESLEARIGTVADMENELKQLRSQFDDSQRQINKLQTEAKQNVRILEMTKDRLDATTKERDETITALRQAHEKELTQLNQAHAGELAAAKHVSELQIHAATIEANNRVLEATTKIKDEYAAKIDALQERIQTLTARVHELELLDKPKRQKEKVEQ